MAAANTPLATHSPERLTLIPERQQPQQTDLYQKDAVIQTSVLGEAVIVDLVRAVPLGFIHLAPRHLGRLCGAVLVAHDHQHLPGPVRHRDRRAEASYPQAGQTPTSLRDSTADEVRLRRDL